MDETAPSTSKGLRAWLTTARGRVAATLTALATGATLVGFAQQNQWVGLIPGSEQPTPTEQPAPTEQPDPGEPPASPTPEPGPQPNDSRFLAELTPVSGGPNLAALRGGAASTSLGLPCGTNSSTDQYREVRYRLTAGYERLTAQVVTSGVTDPEAAVQIDVLSGRNVVGRTIVQGNTTTELVGELSSDLEVAIRVVCQRPGGLVVLRDAAVTRTT